MKTIFLLSLLAGASASAEQLVIHAVIGDQVSEYSVIPRYDDHLLVLRVNNVKKREALIGNKNNEYALKKVNAALAIQRSPSSVCDNRDSSYLEYTDSKGKTTKLEFCFTEQNPTSDAVRSLVNLMLISLY